jgi:1-aminocyclopropane-1-carboxylate deaminase
VDFNTRIDRITDPLITSSGVELYVKRDDLIHPFVSGNKLYKLIYNIQEAQQHGHDTILTFGGAWSNHLVATAAYCKEKGLKSIGIVRGEELDPLALSGGEGLNPALQYCLDQGMQLHFVSRQEYKEKTTPDFISRLNTLFGRFCLVPEGGANALGVKGATHILDGISGYDYVCCACGTGTTLAGIINSPLQPEVRAIGFSVLKGLDTLSTEVENYAGHSNNWTVNNQYHCGGYAKTTTALLAFKQRFEEVNGIPLDKVYTAKLFYGLYDRIAQGHFPTGSRILAIHTGGYSFDAIAPNVK